jgi:hypothetical protein
MITKHKNLFRSERMRTQTHKHTNTLTNNSKWPHVGFLTVCSMRKRFRCHPIHCSHSTLCLQTYISIQFHASSIINYQCWIFKSNKTHFIHSCFNWLIQWICVYSMWNVKCIVVVLLPFLHLFSQEFVTFQNPMCACVYSTQHTTKWVWKCVNMRENELKRREREKERRNNSENKWERFDVRKREKESKYRDFGISSWCE